MIPAGAPGRGRFPERLTSVYGGRKVAAAVWLYATRCDRYGSMPPAGRPDPCPRLSRLDGGKVFLHDAGGVLLAVFTVRAGGKLRRLRDLTPYVPAHPLARSR